ncbi:transketolase-like protein 2 [Anthonomus grandis grandis]|uniref:transketolase-like protein 2 n=1 Tax=Anthonomus grandis grandis TaxID=2921223 RepID=UPI002166A9DD|nr:transketolase-like protein 2 [Anthonomus grandis grandis]XP_050313725.1 transketolase-like protein 2 [Anthonomus grandis grandis]
MSNYHKLESKVAQELRDIANKLRIHSVLSTQAAKSGHPTSCSSIAEIMSVLFFHTMRYKVSNPKDPSSDRFVLSKGHAAPILYAAWAEAGLFPVEDLLNLRKVDSDLEGHPTPRLNFIDVGTGSLGQGLSIAGGMAFVGKYYDKANYRTYCLVGDGESAEGSIWESIHFASYYKLDNLCVIFDVNRLGQSQETSMGHDVDTYRKRLEAFGMNAIVIDGHNVEDLVKAFHTAANTKGKPTAIIAKTLKGKNFPEIEDKDSWHGKPLGAESNRVVEHLKSLIVNQGALQVRPQKPLKDDAPAVDITNITLTSPPNYKIGDNIATRVAYGTALVKIAQSNKHVIALDGDMKNSTFSENLLKFDSARYIECFIAEQSLVGTAIGAACRDRTVPFVSTFACFLTRAFDQIRMGAISQTNVNFVGSHCGVSIGEDGPSQMGLEDLAMFRAVYGSTIFYPADAVATERAIELAANTKGITFTRVNRPTTAVIYPNNQVFQVGKANVIKSTPKDKIVLIGGGVTLQESLAAAKELAKHGIPARVIDPFTVKPLDSETIISNIKAVGGKCVVTEDHYYEGGLGDAVNAAVALEKDIVVKHLAIGELPRSGPPNVLLDLYGISAKHIVQAAQDLVKS